MSACLLSSPAAWADQLPVMIWNTPAPRLGSVVPAPPVPAGFVGASIDYCSITLYDSSVAAERVLVNLLQALAPSDPVLRIGGSGPRTPCPDWRHRALQLTTATIGRLVRSLQAKLILGLNLESHQPSLTRWEVSTLLHTIDPGPRYHYVEAFEIGNEPDLFPRYGPNSPDTSIPYYFSTYLQDFSYWSQIVRREAKDPAFGIAGPSLGRLSLPWISGAYAANFDAFVNGPARPQYLTFHAYPLIATMPCPAIGCPTMGDLLADVSSLGLAQGISPFVARAPGGRQVRVDEMNSDTLGGKHGISDTFGSALWALDTMFELAQAGVAGVNFHTFPGAGYELFDRTSATRWIVSPEYYGLLMFTRAAPEGSRLLDVTPYLPADGGPNVKVWATRGLDGNTRIVLINKDSQTHDVLLQGPGLPVSALAAVQRLQAPATVGATLCPSAYFGTGLCATSGVTLGGRTFGRRVTGSPGGDRTSTGLLAPPSMHCGRAASCVVRILGSGTTVSLPPASAVMLSGHW
jgi:hypothetical protein